MFLFHTAHYSFLLEILFPLASEVLDFLVAFIHLSKCSFSVSPDGSSSSCTQIMGLPQISALRFYPRIQEDSLESSEYPFSPTDLVTTFILINPSESPVADFPSLPTDLQLLSAELHRIPNTPSNPPRRSFILPWLSLCFSQLSTGLLFVLTLRTVRSHF